jgi:NAD(P)-dependent dehydrogenase (short-subunit alcohol dehydrogenase family)
MNEFKDKVAVVTGAASGIGRGLADRFAQEGMRVVLADVEQPALDDAAREMEAGGATVLAVRTDVSRPDDVAALAQAAVDRFGTVNVLCNNAGVGGGKPSWEESLDDWQWVLGVNLWGVVNGIRSFVPIMLANGEEGHIVNTASVAGLIAGGAQASYTASKHAVVGLSQSLALELRMVPGCKIGVSVLCPALTNTRILDADRNRPGGPEERPAEGTPERAFVDMMHTMFATQGMAPSVTAGLVVDAIKNGTFCILTHPEHNPRLSEAHEALIAGGQPLGLAG